MSTVDNKITPNQLNIIINTNVPGYQKIEYKPYMTIPDISKDDKKTMFNPLFKLNKSYVDKVPENLRKKQFFNKGLFDSLLNFTNGTKANTILEATHNGFVDNNIKITLDTIFPENSVLYINKVPYTIADVQWSKGDWKIDTKVKKSQLDSSKITDPILYQTVVKDEIISGENQLHSLPPAIIYGANYTGPKDDTNKPILSSSASGIGVPVPPAPSAPSASSSLPSPPSPPAPSAPPGLPGPSRPPLLSILPSPPEPYTKPILLLTDSDESIVEPIQNYPNVIEPPTKMKTSSKTTAFLRTFFKEPRFFTLINMIYTASNENTKMVIQKSLSEYTSLNESITLNKTDTDELNIDAYIKNVLEIKTIENNGEGNCFFIAVADAINYHNYYNQKNRIISGRYGTGVNLYTQLYLRSLVVRYLQRWNGLDEYLINIAPFTAEQLNNLFVEQINGIKFALRDSGQSDEITPDNYVRIANDIFISHENFLVKNVERVPIDIYEYDTPFKVLEKGQIKNYILSNNFWANEIVISALCAELQLNIIPLQSIKTPTRKSTLRIPYANFYSEINDWNKYLFLYYNQNHYELITFNQKTPAQKNTTSRLPAKKFLKKTKIIFDRNEQISQLPPIYILFIIFGSYFSSIKNQQDKNNFTFKKEIMLTIENIINNNLYDKSYYSTFFYPIFKIYFPNSDIRKPTNLVEPSEIKKNKPLKIKVTRPLKIKDAVHRIEPLQISDPYKGGAYSRYNPYYNPQYNPQYMAHKMERSDMYKDDSQLAYLITIDMELRPGTSLSPEELRSAKCNSKWNSIRKSYADLVGKPYVIPPLYNKTVKNKEETSSNKTQNLRPEPQNNTRKYFKGGKHNKTVKLY